MKSQQATPGGPAPSDMPTPDPGRGVDDIPVPARRGRGSRHASQPAGRLGPHVLTRAIRSFRDDPKLSLLAVAIIAAALVVESIFLAVIVHVSHVSQGLVPGDEVNVYLESDLEQQAVAALVTALGALDGVQEVLVISPQEAARILAEDLPDWKLWLEELEANPLPTTLVATLVHASRGTEVATAAEDMEHVVEVQSPGSYARDLSRFTERVRRVTTVLVGLMVATVLFIVTAVMRLALTARAREVEILRFLGATEEAIRAPFLIEGLVMGSLAGLLAAAAGLAANRALGPIVLPTLLAGASPTQSQWIPVTALVATASMAPVLGLAGAWLAARLGLRRP